MPSRVIARVTGLSQYYVGGQERMEIWIDKTSAKGLPFAEGARVVVQLVVSSQTYQAGLRATKRTKYVWICPDLLDDHGEMVHLAEVLVQHGYIKNQQVYLDVNEKSVYLVAS